MQINEIIQKYKDKLDRLDLEILLSYSIDKPREFLFTHPEYKLTTPEVKKLQDFLDKRINHEPIAYITNNKEFYGYNFYVDRRVLIPRPETEELVRLALEELSSNNIQNINIIDIGTGSGCISISIALEIAKMGNFKSKKIKIWAIDISEDALEVAKKNYDTYQSSIRKYNNIEIIFEHLDILDKKHVNSVLKNTKFDIVISNPPYIETEKIQILSQDIKEYEPHLALDGGSDGQKFFQSIQDNLKDNSSDKTVFIFEGMKDKFIYYESKSE